MHALCQNKKTGIREAAFFTVVAHSNRVPFFEGGRRSATRARTNAFSTFSHRARRGPKSVAAGNCSTARHQRWPLSGSYRAISIGQARRDAPGPPRNPGSQENTCGGTRISREHLQPAICYFARFLLLAQRFPNRGAKPKAAPNKNLSFWFLGIAPLKTRPGPLGNPWS